MDSLLGEGRTLYMDNYYTSVELPEKLLSRRTHLVGTLRLNRKRVPKEIQKAKLRRGDMMAKQCQNKIIIGKWKDKRDVSFLTTKETPKMIGLVCIGGRTQKKPSTVIEYNSAKGYIDLSDQMAAYHGALRKRVKWYRKVAFEYLTNMAVVNSHYLYSIITKTKKKYHPF